MPPASTSMKRSAGSADSCSSSVGILLSLPLRTSMPASGKGQTLEQLLRRPGMTLGDFEPLLRKHDLWPTSAVRKSIEIEVRYQGYIEQQQREAEKMQRMSLRRIPADLDYAQISGLSREVKEKLTRTRPKDLATAARIPGITPAAVSILNIQLELRQNKARTES